MALQRGDHSTIKLAVLPSRYIHTCNDYHTGFGEVFFYMISYMQFNHIYCTIIYMYI